MIDVNDRVPLYPGRVKMTPVSGQANVYDMVRADQPQKGGTPLNRNTFRQTQADIRTYPIATGNSVTAGDVVDVANVLAPVTKPLGEYTEGDVVQLNEGGVPVDFYVAKHDYEAALNGSGRTLLVRKLPDNNSGNDYVWNSSSFNNLSGSTIDTTLNNAYKTRFDNSVQVAMATTKFYYTIGNGNASIGTLERSIFLLSNTEIGGTQESYFNIEGETLPIASVLRPSTLDNYSRSVVTTDAQSVMYFTASGGHGTLVANKARAARPCFTLPNTFLIDTGEKIQTGEKEITKSVVAEANVETVLFVGSASNIATCRLNDKYSICVCGSSVATQAYLVDNSSGNSVSTADLGLSAANNLCIARLSDTEFIVGCGYDNAGLTMLGTVSDRSISFGGRVTGFGSGSVTVLVPLSSTKVFSLVSRPGGAVASCILTIANSNILLGNVTQFSGTIGVGFRATLLPDDSSGNKRVCVCFSDANDGNKGKAVIATINSSNVVTWGSVVTVANNVQQIDTTNIGDTVYVIYSSNLVVSAKALFVSGINISGQSNELQLSTGSAQYPSICVAGDSVVCAFSHVPKSIARKLSLQGTTISAGEEYHFNASQSYFTSASAISSERLILCYADGGNNNYGTDTILEVNGNQIAGGFTMNSTQAIALESGEAGQNIEVIFAGTTAADFVTEGQKIPSKGVYGYGPVAGWLNVIPYWAKEAGVRIATGSYVGTGTYGEQNPNSLTFPFAPKFVMVYTNAGIYPVAGSAAEMGDCFIWSVGIEKSDLNAKQTFALARNTFTWYAKTNVGSTQAPINQLNVSGKTYFYFAIG